MSNEETKFTVDVTTGITDADMGVYNPYGRVLQCRMNQYSDKQRALSQRYFNDTIAIALEYTDVSGGYADFMTHIAELCDKCENLPSEEADAVLDQLIDFWNAHNEFPITIARR